MAVFFWNASVWGVVEILKLSQDMTTTNKQ